MTIMPSRLLLDTNIWLDLFASNRPGRKTAMGLVDWAVDNDVLLLYAAISAKDLYYVSQELEKRILRDGNIPITPSASAALDEYAWGCLHAMMEMATVVPIDQSDLWLASKYRAIHGDFEDDLILAAVTRSKADYLITNDRTLLHRAPIAAISSDDALALFKA